jgi:hypothetical protein
MKVRIVHSATATYEYPGRVSEPASLEVVYRRVARYVTRTGLEAVATNDVMTRTLRFLVQPSLLLLLTLVGAIVAYPFLETSDIGRASLNAINIAVMVLLLRVVGHTRGLRRAGLLLALPPILLHGWYVLHGGQGYGLATTIALAVYYGFAIGALLAYVLRDDIATTDELFATICMYVPLAMLWACLYWMVKYFQPNAFYVNPQNNPDARVTWWDLLYFSFTTLTSVGYGEITPATSHARSVVMLEQITGVMYVALLIARITSMTSRRGRNRGDDRT